MRKLIYLLLTLLVLTACTDRWEYALMRHGLDSLNERNRNDEPFTAADVQPYIDYFDRHGEPNDRLLAYYLLGRAYHEQSEAPMALEQYHKAIECADTLSHDCDFGQLSRVYAQMGEVFYSQYMFPQSRKQYEHSTRFALMGKDTLSALLCYEQQGIALIEMGVLDSAIIISEKVSDLYTQNGYPKNSAIALGSIINTLISQGNYEKATRYMKRYEEESGLFNRNGDIEKGRETYYFFKGNLFLKEQKLDSAEYWYRRELQNGLDFSNQNGGALGLAMVFEQRHQPDSAAKYYQYAYAMNDSVYAQMATEEVARMQAMYDYSRHQQIASKKTEETRIERTNRYLAVGVIIILLLLFSVIVIRFIRKEKKGLTLYRETLGELKSVRSERDSLKAHESEYEQLIATKEKRITELERFLSKYGKQLYFTKANAERCLQESVTYKRISSIAVRGRNLTEADWEDVRLLVSEYLPGFDDFMVTNKSQLKANEYPVCLLLRLHFKAVDIADMLDISKSQVSLLCADIMQRLFEKKGGSKELSSLLAKIF